MPKRKSNIDTSTMINVADIETSDLEYKDEVIASLNEAENYLVGFDWCVKIIDGWIAASFGYILNIFLFRVQIYGKPSKNNFFWIIVGDIPPAYFDVASTPTKYDALKAYINVMQDWVDNVNGGNSLELCYPVNVPPEKKYADMLDIRLQLLREDYLPLIQRTVIIEQYGDPYS